MIAKVVRVSRRQDLNVIRDDLAFWLSRPSDERFAAVELLRKQWHGDTTRLQRTVTVVQRETG